MVRSLREAVATVFLALIVALGSDLAFEFGLFSSLDNNISARRMQIDRRDASGEIVFLAIDKESLDTIPGWPWRRSLYARILEVLAARGATDVLFDIDFSAPSSYEMDFAFAQAIEDSGSLVVLAGFAQEPRIRAEAGSIAYNIPIEMLLENAWLGAVNIRPDTDGIVRRAPFGMLIDGEDVPSFAALMSGRFGSYNEEFAVNFSISPSSVPIYSVIDLLDGKIPEGALDGKTVLVGAHALELRDNLSVPVHGILPGPLLHILAAETLRQDLALRRVSPIPILAGLCLLVLGVRLRAGWRRLRYTGGFTLAAGLGLEAVAAYLQIRHQFVLPSVAGHAFLAFFLVAVASRELELRKLFHLIASREARNTQDILARVIGDSGDAVLVIDAEGAVIVRNPQWRGLFGDAVECGPEHGLAGVPPELSDAVKAAFARGQGPAVYGHGVREIEWPRPDGIRHIEFTATLSRIERSEGRWGGRSVAVAIVCVTARDVTRRREQEKRVEHLSRFDPLSGATRRLEMATRLRAHLSATSGTGEIVAVWALNLHRFRMVNDTLGRAVGDRLLVALVDRLNDSGLGLSLCARLGGNVFGLYNESRRVTADDLGEVAERIADMVRRPFLLDGNTVFTDATIGISSTLDTQGDDAATTADLLLDHAETALDTVRKRGQTGIGTFDPGLVARQARARLLERELWDSIENDELYVLYQPQVTLGERRFCGAEALLRWKHPELGFVSPAEFIPSAEASGFIQHIGRFVLRRACEDFARAGLPGTIAVNVSPQQFQSGDLLRDVLDALRASGLSGHQLHLEMTESLFVQSSDHLREMLGDIRALGISLALDDFGSGYSSFGYLSRFGIDKIKVDQMFVRALHDNPKNQGILRSIKLLSDELGTRLICEGIETEEEAAFLRGIGCDEGQGYLFGKPMPLDELAIFAGVSGRSERPGPAASHG